VIDGSRDTDSDPSIWQCRDAIVGYTAVICPGDAMAEVANHDTLDDAASRPEQVDPVSAIRRYEAIRDDRIRVRIDSVAANGAVDNRVRDNTLSHYAAAFEHDAADAVGADGAGANAAMRGQAEAAVAVLIDEQRLGDADVGTRGTNASLSPFLNDSVMYDDVDMARAHVHTVEGTGDATDAESIQIKGNCIRIDENSMFA
jgi:hypothetical protein